MLQTIREHTQGWIARVIITIIISTFALWGIHSYFVSAPMQMEVASVNGVDISKQQLSLAYERVRRQIQLEYGINHTITVKDESLLKQRALQALIEIEALKQAAIQQGYRISEDQVDRYLQNMPDFQVNGQFSVDRFKAALSSTLLSAGEFLDLIHTSLLIDQPKLGIVFSSFELPEETSNAIALVNQERDIDVITLPFSSVAASSIVITPEKIAAYYAAHHPEFMTQEQVVVDYVELSLRELAAQMTLSDAELKSYYNDNQNAYALPMRWVLADIEVPLAANASKEDSEKAHEKALALAAALKKGEDIAKLSQGNASSNLIKQGAIGLRQVPVDLQKAVAELTHPNDVSAPIKTPRGYVVLKVIEVKPAQIASFDSVRDKVKAQLAKERAEQHFGALRDQLADESYEHPESLAPVAKKLNLAIKTSDPFVHDKAGKGIAQYTKVRNVAFSHDLLNSGLNSDVIPLDNDAVIVMRLKSHEAAKLLPLATVSKDIEKKLQAQAAETQVQQLAATLQGQLQGGADPQQVATTHHLAWQKQGYIGRYAQNVDSAILDTVFRMPPQNSGVNHIAYGVTKLPTGYAVVAFKGMRPGTINDHKQYTMFAEQVQTSQGLLEYELYKQSQISAAKIKLMD